MEQLSPLLGMEHNSVRVRRTQMPQTPTGADFTNAFARDNQLNS